MSNVFLYFPFSGSHEISFRLSILTSQRSIHHQSVASKCVRGKIFLHFQFLFFKNNLHQETNFIECKKLYVQIFSQLHWKQKK